MIDMTLADTDSDQRWTHCLKGDSWITLLFECIIRDFSVAILITEMVTDPDFANA